MTDNEIIQALEYCAYHDMTCRDCPYAGRFSAKFCDSELHIDALKIIKRQQAEIERLQDRLEEKQATSDKTSEWISVKDRLPEFTEEEMARYSFFGDTFFPEFNVMILGATQATTLYFDGERWYDEEAHCYCVTHWQPMPQPPKGD